MAPRFLFDTNSPYAYLAAMRVDDVVGPGVAWEPIAFGFLLQAQDRRPWSFDEPTRSEGIAEIEARAEARGLPPVRWPPGWPIASYRLEPGRAIAAALAHGREREVARAIFRRTFVTGEGVLEPGTVRACWVDAGLDGGSYDEELARGKVVLRELTERAIADGVYGVPTVVVGEQRFWGDDRLEDAAAAAAAQA